MSRIVEEVQYRQYGLLQKFYIKKKNNDDMLTIGYTDSKDVSLRAPGYIITKDGEYIIVPEEILHSKFFSKFLYIYRGESDWVEYDTFSGAIELVKEGFMVYIGIRENDLYYNGLQEDIGFYMPDSITPQQFIAHNNLIDKTDGLSIASKFNDIYFNYVDSKGKLTESKPIDIRNNIVPKKL